MFCQSHKIWVIDYIGSGFERSPVELALILGATVNWKVFPDSAVPQLNIAGKVTGQNACLAKIIFQISHEMNGSYLG